jgi:hypothetical protein
MHLLIGNGSWACLLNGTESAKDVASFLIGDRATCDLREVNRTCTPVSGKVSNAAMGGPV